MGWLLILLLLLPQPGASRTVTKKKATQAKAAPAAPSEWPIQSIAVEGVKRYTKQQVVAASGLSAGQRAGKPEFDAARDRLMATGVFESAGYRFGPAPGGKSYAVTFEVTEVADVYPIEFDRLQAPAQQLLQLLGKSDPLFRDQIPATDTVLKRYARLIEDYVASKGQKETIIGRLATGDSGALVVLFRPAASPPSVAEVRFTGNQALTETALQNAIASIAVGSQFSESRFRQILDTTIRPLYEEQGRIRVSFSSIQAEPSKSVNGVRVTVAVAENDVYKLHDVQITGVGIDVARLQKAAAIKTGDVADFKEIGKGLGRIRSRLGRDGYMSPKLDVERRIQDAAKTVDLVVHVEKGPQFMFGTLTVKGLDMHGEAAIRKMWALKSGGPFNVEYPEYFLQRVREDGIFDNLRKTRAVTEPDEKTKTVNVTLIFN